MSYVSILHVFCLVVKFARFSSSSGKLTISHIIAHGVVKFWVISIFLISIKIYWHRLSHGCSYMRAITCFLFRRKICSLFFRLGKIDHISQYCPLSSLNLSYINSIYLISIEIYWHRLSHGPKICCVPSLTNAQESFKLVLILTICHTFSVRSQNTFLSADFCR